MEGQFIRRTFARLVKGKTGGFHPPSGSSILPSGIKALKSILSHFNSTPDKILAETQKIEIWLIKERQGGILTREVIP